MLIKDSQEVLAASSKLFELVFLHKKCPNPNVLLNFVPILSLLEWVVTLGKNMTGAMGHQDARPA